MLKQECFLPSTEYAPLAIEKLTCKTIYNTLLKHQHLPPPTSEKRLIEYIYIYIILDVLLCSIAEYFYELCRILASP